MEFVENRQITFRQITGKLAEDFKEYLLSLPALTGGTPSIYLRAFKKVVRKACKEKIIRDNPVLGVTLSSSTAIHKDVLTIDEIIKLNNTPCKHGDVKRAFIFSCLTGLRQCDIRRLTWVEIKETKEGLMIELKQAKTGKNLKGNLNNDAVVLIGSRGEKGAFLFKLPSKMW